MKKILAILLMLTMIISMFVACGGTKEEPATEEPAIEEEVVVTPAEEQDTEVAEEVAGATYNYPGGVRVGLAVNTSMVKSKSVEGDKNGVAQSDSTVVAVLLDEEGRINKIAIDVAQNKIEFDATGQLVNGEEIFRSKRELGDEYGMKPASGIGKEWFEQADAIEDYVIGKTLEEIKGISLNPEGVTEDADLAAGATIGIEGYITTIEKAIVNSKETTASIEDGLGLGIVTNTGQSVSVEDEKEGTAQAYSSYIAVTADAQGVITSATVDASQSNVTFGSTGEITSDIDEAGQTKTELGEDYGMRAVSEIGKEWDEQANALANYLVGKTYEDVVGVAIVDGTATSEDLAAGVTISLGDLTAALDKAYKQAVATAGAAATETIEGTEVPVEEDAPAEEADGPEETTEEVAIVAE